MASWQAHLVVALMRWRIKRRLAGCSDVVTVRRVFDTKLFRTPSDVRIKSLELGSVRCEWIEYPPLSHGPVLLYLHGGGYVGCSPRSHRAITVTFARQGFRVCVPDYRLAPEHPFPAAVDDVVAVYRDLLAWNPGEPIVVAGDSAGGGLSLALMVSIRDLKLPLPAAAVLFSPWVDLAATGESLVENDARCAMFRGCDIGPGARAYLRDTDPRHPLASPLYADLSGLPPILIHAAQDEVLRDDSVRLARAAQTAGVPTEIGLWPVVPHCWQIVHFMPEARESLLIASEFLRSSAAANSPVSQSA